MACDFFHIRLYLTTTVMLALLTQLKLSQWKTNRQQLAIRGSFKNCFLKSIKPHDLGSILSTSYFYSFILEGLYIIF